MRRGLAADVYHEARRIGVNLNQTARALNFFPERGARDALNSALGELLDLLAMLRRVTEAARYSLILSNTNRLPEPATEKSR